ncbi:hypothetical protein AAG570_003726 [Ranatra chinensis]|uniref:Uncharacterized protein n=1 Tax=Ranatra chinensis TaxID=642074 RepID=A0ABD0Y4F9_9HEMI
MEPLFTKTQTLLQLDGRSNRSGPDGRIGQPDDAKIIPPISNAQRPQGLLSQEVTINEITKFRKSYLENFCFRSYDANVKVSVVARLETVTRIDKAAVTAQEFKAATAMNGELEGEEEGEGESDEDVTEEGGSEGEGEGRKSSKSSLYQGATPRPIIRDTDDDDTTSDEPESDDN